MSMADKPPPPQLTPAEQAAENAAAAAELKAKALADLKRHGQAGAAVTHPNRR